MVGWDQGGGCSSPILSCLFLNLSSLVSPDQNQAAFSLLTDCRSLGRGPGSGRVVLMRSAALQIGVSVSLMDVPGTTLHFCESSGHRYRPVLGMGPSQVRV